MKRIEREKFPKRAEVKCTTGGVGVRAGVQVGRLQDDPEVNQHNSGVRYTEP
jgi:hypothetical protein